MQRPRKSTTSKTRSLLGNEGISPLPRLKVLQVFSLPVQYVQAHAWSAKHLSQGLILPLPGMGLHPGANGNGAGLGAAAPAGLCHPQQLPWGHPGLSPAVSTPKIPPRGQSCGAPSDAGGGADGKRHPLALGAVMGGTRGGGWGQHAGFPSAWGGRMQLVKNQGRYLESNFLPSLKVPL